MDGWFRSWVVLVGSSSLPVGKWRGFFSLEISVVSDLVLIRTCYGIASAMKSDNSGVDKSDICR